VKHVSWKHILLVAERTWICFSERVHQEMFSPVELQFAECRGSNLTSRPNFKFLFPASCV